MLVTQEERSTSDQGQMEPEGPQSADPALPDTVTEAMQASPPADADIISGTEHILVVKFITLI